MALTASTVAGKLTGEMTIFLRAFTCPGDLVLLVFLQTEGKIFVGFFPFLFSMTVSESRTSSHRKDRLEVTNKKRRGATGICDRGVRGLSFPEDPSKKILGRSGIQVPSVHLSVSDREVDTCTCRPGVEEGYFVTAGPTPDPRCLDSSSGPTRRWRTVVRRNREVRREIRRSCPLLSLLHPGHESGRPDGPRIPI